MQSFYVLNELPFLSFPLLHGTYWNKQKMKNMNAMKEVNNVKGQSPPEFPVRKCNDLRLNVAKFTVAKQRPVIYLWEFVLLEQYVS